MKYKKVVQPGLLKGAHCPMCGRYLSLGQLFGPHREAHFYGQYGLQKAKIQFEVVAVIDTKPDDVPHPLVEHVIKED